MYERADKCPYAFFLYNLVVCCAYYAKFCMNIHNFTQKYARCIVNIRNFALDF